MNNAEFQLQALGDPRLAVHATSRMPAWLWSTDGTRILWANPVGARVFGAESSSALAKKTFGPAEPHRRQVARLAGRLLANGAVRLERLQGFGATPGMLATCGCSRLDFPDGSHGILVAAGNTAGRIMPLVERLQRLVEGLSLPVAAFTADGLLIGSSEAARPLLGFHDLVEAGLDEPRNDALKQGAVATSINIGRMVLQRVGTGADVALVALLVPDAAHAARPEPVAAVQPEQKSPEPAPSAVAEAPAPHNPEPTPTGEAPPAELSLFDALAEPPAVEGAAASEPPARERQLALPPDPAVDVDAIADEPPVLSAEIPAAPVAKTVKAPAWFDEPQPSTRRLPLRFMWQMDHEGRFSLGADEFTRLIGPRTAASFGRLWSEIA